MELLIDDRTVRLFPSEAPGAPLVVLNGEAGEGGRVLAEARALGAADFSLACVETLNWDDDLTPWPNPPVFRGGNPCGGRADDYLGALVGAILPRVRAALPQAPEYVALAGYSLAGLFALYAPYRTDAFARIVSGSGSLWYPGFLAFAETHALVRTPERLYLSLGDREARTRNPAMKPVEENTRRMAALMEARGVNSVLEMNPGGHFNEPERRLARGLAWALKD